jgi:hypothetical protein
VIDWIANSNILVLVLVLAGAAAVRAVFIQRYDREIKAESATVRSVYRIIAQDSKLWAPCILQP